jgi:hypothetical protein
MHTKYPASSNSNKWMVFPSMSFTEKSVAVVSVVCAPENEIVNIKTTIGNSFFIYEPVFPG